VPLHSRSTSSTDRTGSSGVAVSQSSSDLEKRQNQLRRFQPRCRTVSMNDEQPHFRRPRRRSLRVPTSNPKARTRGTDERPAIPKRVVEEMHIKTMDTMILWSNNLMFLDEREGPYILRCKGQTPCEARFLVYENAPFDVLFGRMVCTKGNSHR
jgi:hypothetical protein